MQRFRTIIGRWLNGASVRPQVPTDFDPSAYLALYPDVRKAGVDPRAHYAKHGRQEGRPYAFPKLTPLRRQPATGQRPALLIVCHEASRSGAPILGLNLVQHLGATHEVVVLLLGKGPLVEAFAAAASSSFLCADLRFCPSDAAAISVMRELCREFPFTCAIVNSVESRSVLQGLDSAGIPALSLLHEFAAYTRPSNAFPRVLFWSTMVVFSAPITRDDALRRLELRDAAHLALLAQGKCTVGAPDPLPSSKAVPNLRVADVPPGRQPIIVLGVGAVQYRKGVDLFIECAARIRATDPASEYRFFWVGGGYQPGSDLNYSAYLADQIHRAGLSRHFAVLGETDQLEQVYEQADLFLLTSRLDPLPNVAIDAAIQGLPVLCFAETTGIADFMAGAGLGDSLVADYLDTGDMARKAVALAQSAERREAVSRALQTAAATSFSMQSYVEALRGLMDKVIARRRQEEDDLSVIRRAGVLRPDFCVHPAHFQLGDHLDQADGVARAYARSWATGLYRRKPFPGFHPGVYAELNALGNAVDPLAHYLRAGRPDGPWTAPVITPATATASPARLRRRRVALHIHAYYVDLVGEILDRLDRNTVTPDLFVSVTSEQHRETLSARLAGYKGRVARLEVMPNRGRDLGPFLSMFAGDVLDGYEVVGHLHTKKSVDVDDPALGRSWYTFLLENLVGGTGGAMLDRIISSMDGPGGPEMVYADDPYVFGDESNRPFTEAIAKQAGWPAPPLYHGFPVGSMFWARPATVRPLLDLGLGPQDYPAEPLPYDGTILHGLERALGLAGWGRAGALALTNVPGVTR